MKKQVSELVAGDRVVLGTGILTVKKVIQDTPLSPEWRIQWEGLTNNLSNRVDFLPTEIVEVEE